jgi:hypothetical protein
MASGGTLRPLSLVYRVAPVGRCCPTRIQKHIRHDGSADEILLRVGQVNTSNAKSRTHPKQPRAGKDAVLADRTKIIDFHFNRRDLALAPEVTVNGHSNRNISHRRRNPSVSYTGAIGQLPAESALNRHAVAMNLFEFHPKQHVEWNLRQQITDLPSGQLGLFHSG